MSQEHDKTKLDDVPVSDGIHPEPAPFEPGYQPGTLPQISVPDLPDDAQSLSAEALAQVPTLTELVDEPVEVVVTEAVADVAASHEVPETVVPELEPSIQDTPAQADTWGEGLQVRMGKLTDDIHTLNARLDQLEERNKTKV